ncbi:MAG: histidinol dehydrogenase [Alphaproteobacteria bacterium]|jgi:histidinol dehydrogenase|nr:histidinol dehydrogenase [Alphaproteobacteria bacterium]MDP6588670.1 histidinol dehydrogenase [Alphaproteobacteria bacterium]MDP6819491.1 histidinol dehydrogenase [Alphaproteobacteria bacterium]
MARRLNSAEPGFAAAFAALVAEKRAGPGANGAQVAEIIADVRARGDQALIEYTARFDGLELDAMGLRLKPDEIAAAAADCPAETRAALAFAAARIEDFHRRQMPAGLDYTDASGVRLGARWNALAAAGLYVPGGTAAYPSSVLMNAIPARVAGVARIVMTVPTPNGALNPALMAAAEIAGLDEIYRIGGAQAVAALAHGSASIRPVDKIVGPGNEWVAEAKRQVFGIVGIDMIAGPSEILVLADGANEPDWVAADLMSQAEHDSAAQAILITDDAGFADAVAAAVERLLETLPRRDIAGMSWRAHGAIIVIGDLDEAPALIDRIAPEHLELAVAEPQALFDRVNHAGAVFLGRHTPEALGDYVAGPNHVLPTSGSARFSSGLSVYDFLKRTSFAACDGAGLAAIGPAARILAEAEGLDAHALSLALRLDKPDA